LPANDLAKFFWALANLTDEGSPYVFNMAKLDFVVRRFQDTYINEMVEECDMTKVALCNAAGVLYLLDRMNRNRILDRQRDEAWSRKWMTADTHRDCLD
jgi:hypothetical protein